MALTAGQKKKKNDPKADESLVQVTLREVFKTLKRYMSTDMQKVGRGEFQIVPEVTGGQFCGCSIYIKGRITNIKGLDSKTNVWKTLANDSSGYENFLLAMNQTIKRMLESMDENDRNKWEKHLKDIFVAFSDRSADPKTPVAVLARSLAINSPPVKQVSLSGQECFKLVPTLDSFPEALQALDARRLLSLFPDAEASQLMLLLGRVVVGASDTTMFDMEGALEHTFRSYGIMVGMEAGLGKSTLMTYLRKTLVKLGYTVEMMHINDTKFGWGSIAEADLALVDDLNAESQKRLLTDARVKSLVSNGYLKVEEKGQPAVNVRSRTVILGATNHHNPSDYIGMDSGSISRVNQLQTYNSYELEQKWGTDRDYRTKQLWESLAKEYNVSTECLCAYLLRRCADIFMSVCGYTYDSVWGYRKTNPDLLEEVIKGNRSLFDIDTNLGHAEELIESTVKAMALTAAHCPEVEEELMALDFSASLVTAMIKYNAYVKPEEDQGVLEGLRLKHMSKDVKHYVKKKARDLELMASSMSSDGAFKAVTSELRSTKGFGYPSHVSYYIPQFNACKRMLPKLIEQYRNTTPSQSGVLLVTTILDIVELQR